MKKTIETISSSILLEREMKNIQGGAAVPPWEFHSWSPVWWRENLYQWIDENIRITPIGVGYPVQNEPAIA